MKKGQRKLGKTAFFKKIFNDYFDFPSVVDVFIAPP